MSRLSVLERKEVDFDYRNLAYAIMNVYVCELLHRGSVSLKYSYNLYNIHYLSFQIAIFLGIQFCDESCEIKRRTKKGFKFLTFTV
jgi:hypothetical protein